MPGIEGIEGIEGNTYEISFKFKVFDEEALKSAFEDLENAKVLYVGSSYRNNTIEENLRLVLKNLDVLANYRGNETITFLDMGFEEVQ